ncbi:MAG: 30S ribosomal protein S17 [bacterium]|nr:30S ribosomal protein S17 [bacterium]
MSKVLTGTIVSVVMKKTVVVEVTTHKPHPLYRKLQKRSKRFKASTQEKSLRIGDLVEITETRPMAKDMHFTVSNVVRKSKESSEKEQK